MSWKTLITDYLKEEYGPPAAIAYLYGPSSELLPTGLPIHLQDLACWHDRVKTTENDLFWLAIKMEVRVTEHIAADTASQYDTRSLLVLSSRRLPSLLQSLDLALAEIEYAHSRNVRDAWDINCVISNFYYATCQFRRRISQLMRHDHLGGYAREAFAMAQGSLENFALSSNSDEFVAGLRHLVRALATQSSVSMDQDDDQ